MPIEDFFHEVAFNQMNAGRGQFVPQEPWWKRVWRLLTPVVRRVIVIIIVLALCVAGYVCRQPLSDLLRSQPAHKPGAADVLTVTHHRSTEDQRLHRLALACAREDDPSGCMDALQQLLKLTDASTVVTVLQTPEVRALRVNEFFNRFALEVEQAQAKPAAPPLPAPISAPKR